MTHSNKNSRSILELTHEKARQYFLEHESYCDFHLPKYFHFDEVLQSVNDKLADKDLFSFSLQDAKDRLCKSDNINYRILNNKDGKYAWRPFQLIHPALYVSLVQKITTKENWEHIQNQFKKFAENEHIKCMSIPRQSLTRKSDKAEQILSWWEKVEQHSISMALNYPCLTHTDIIDCYGSIYTHSVAWAMHGKYEARNNRDGKDWIGNQIDSHLQYMSKGQTNGIPQGSTLMDFIAEMVLGYADSELEKRIKQAGIDAKDYKILRYRDDYRIFTKSQIDGDHIMKCLTETMIELGFKLSADKTSISSNIITGSMKPDKFYRILQKQEDVNLQRHLLIIYDLSMQFPNCGSLFKSMKFFHKKLYKIYNAYRLYKFHAPHRISELYKYGKIDEGVTPLISIVTDIAHKNPRTYPYSAAIISLLLSFEEDSKQRHKLLKKVIGRFLDIPNTGHLNIWMQRVALGVGCIVDFNEDLCKLANYNDKSITIWNNFWLKQSLKDVIDTSSIIDQKIKYNLNSVITPKEMDLFRDEDYNYF